MEPLYTLPNPPEPMIAASSKSQVAILIWVREKRRQRSNGRDEATELLVVAVEQCDSSTSSGAKFGLEGFLLEGINTDPFSFSLPQEMKKNAKATRQNTMNPTVPPIIIGAR
uniref:Uncharacterized protein n=1 Tax=Opuntia streptacantha TaxID=393608 RepID=A0A7C9E4E5_OPUST